MYKHTFPNGKVYIGIACLKPSALQRTDGSGYRPRDIRKDISQSVIQKDMDENIINKFQSIHYASQYTGVNRQCISFCLKGIYKTAGGLIWESDNK